MYIRHHMENCYKFRKLRLHAIIESEESQTLNHNPLAAALSSILQDKAFVVYLLETDRIFAHVYKTYNMHEQNEEVSMQTVSNFALTWLMCIHR